MVISDVTLTAAGFGRIATDTDVSIGQLEVDPWTWWRKVSAAMHLVLFLIFKRKSGPDQIWCPIYGPPRTRVLLWMISRNVIPRKTGNDNESRISDIFLGDYLRFGFGVSEDGVEMTVDFRAHVLRGLRSAIYETSTRGA